MFSKRSNSLKIPFIEPGDPFEISDVSSAYWESWAKFNKNWSSGSVENYEN